MLRSLLDDLPDTLDETYEHALLRIEKSKRGYAHSLFQCLTVSIRPLRIEELADVLSALLYTGEDSEHYTDWRPDDAQEEVLSMCSSLVTVVHVGSSSIVQFSHFSVKEFLTSSRLAHAKEDLSCYHILSHSAHSTISRASLTVLLNLGDQVDRGAIENHPLACYASRYWVDHAKVDGDVLPSIQDLMGRLFDPEKPHFATWLWLYDLDRPWEGHMASVRPLKPKATPLYYAALCGFRSLVEHFSKLHPGDVNASGESYDTPLHVACAKRDINTALALLEHGADINLFDDRGRSPLHTASRSGRIDVVKFLLDHKANVDIKEDRTDWTPLHLAVQYGELEVCRLLLKHGAAVDKTNTDQQTPLHEASKHGSPEIARLLIEQGANTMFRDNGGWIPLHNASRYGHLNTVEIFIGGGVDVNVRTGDGETPLHIASRRGNLEVVHYLLKHKADVDCFDNKG